MIEAIIIAIGLVVATGIPVGVYVHEGKKGRNALVVQEKPSPSLIDYPDDEDDIPELDFTHKEEMRKEGHDEWTAQFNALLPVEELPDYIKPSLEDEEVERNVMKAWSGSVVQSTITMKTPDGKEYLINTMGYPETHYIIHKSYKRDITEEWNALQKEMHASKKKPVWQLEQENRKYEKEIELLTKRFDEVSKEEPTHESVTEMVSIADRVDDLRKERTTLDKGHITADKIHANAITADKLVLNAGGLTAPNYTSYYSPLLNSSYRYGYGYDRYKRPYSRNYYLPSSYQYRRSEYHPVQLPQW